MNTPRVKKQQQRQLKKSLSAKKGPVKGLRNVLAQPYDTQWPVLSNDKGSCLEELLDRLLPGLKPHTPSIPWSQLRKMGKDERRVARQKLCPDSKEIANDASTPKFITLGVNAVTRDLEKERLCSVLLDSGVESLLIKHVIVMAQNNQVPILLVPFLKKVTLNNVGFASAAMGLKREAIDSNHSFNEVYQEIVKFAQSVSSTEKVKSSEDWQKSPKIKDVEMRVLEKDSSKTFFSLSTSVYKYRSTLKERTFVPPRLVEKSSNNCGESDDFIAIGKDDTEVAEPKFFVSRKKKRYMDISDTVNEKQTRKSIKSMCLDSDETPPAVKRKQENITYLPLKVKRIQGNNNRVKATKSAKSKKKSSLNKK